MARAMPVSRFLKNEVENCLRASDFAERLDRWTRFPARKVINPLFSFLYHHEEIIKWHAVTAIGVVVAGLAARDMESARVIMRRLIWNLNDESGGMAWGAPEAMGEIMARHEKLAAEYGHILLSYVCEEENLFENLYLERGVLWGLGRLSQVRPHHLQDASSCLAEFLLSDDDYLRGFAAWTFTHLDAPTNDPRWMALKADSTSIKIYIDMKFITVQLRDLVAGVLN